MAFHPTLSSITWTRRTAGVGAVGCRSPCGVMASETSTMVSARTLVRRGLDIRPTVGAGRGGQHHVRFTDLTDVGVDLRFRLAPRSLDDGDAVALLPPPHERLEGGPRRVGRRQPHHRGVGSRNVDPGVPVEVALPGGFENRCRFVDDPWRGVCDGNARDGRRVGLGAIAVWQDLDVADEGSEPEGAQGVSDCRRDVVLGWQDLDRPSCLPGGASDRMRAADERQEHNQGTCRPTHLGYFLALSAAASADRAATKASCGTSTRPIVFIRFLPSFCFSSSLRLRVMSPP